MLGSVHERAGVGADVVRPKDHGQNTSPETQVQVADGEEPCGAPKASRECVLLDADALRVIRASVCCHEFLHQCVLRVQAQSDALLCLIGGAQARTWIRAAIVLLQPPRVARYG